MDSIIMHDIGCGKCGTPAETKCSRCRLVRYCNRECQKKDWKRHKKTCSIPKDEDVMNEDDMYERVKTGEVTLKVEIRESPLHGKGVFATVDIPKKTKFCFYDGDLINTGVSIKMSKTKDDILSIVHADEFFQNWVVPDPNYDRMITHPSPKMNGYIVVGKSEIDSSFGIGQFINDGAKPNLSGDEVDFVSASSALNEYQDISMRAMNCEVGQDFWFIANRDIQRGEELLTHYGFEFWVHKIMLQAERPQSILLLYALHDQETKPFNLRKFFSYDVNTLTAFLNKVCQIPLETINNYKTPKDLVFELMEQTNIMNASTLS